MSTPRHRHNFMQLQQRLKAGIFRICKLVQVTDHARLRRLISSSPSTQPTIGPLNSLVIIANNYAIIVVAVLQVAGRLLFNNHWRRSRLRPWNASRTRQIDSKGFGSRMVE
ncbi:hypothetical protein K432DRAFT_114415 [Lepidopterella palustris CBS 459.81]|uniref:Uncharacterized protein n=1 Tax=Lepidopterella palustris CBS 459.81 TaxID=1314670 RepID=A0A8E2JCR9_9PEZI|nr:hypothetical protein K432DRAFT_114415 [Lepidopterella palustris CBS 459.81]